MLLSKLFKGAPDIDIEQLSTDSRLPMKNAIFFCMSGIKYDGHEYVNEAVKNGAKVIVYSQELKDKPHAIYVKVKDVSDTLKKVANVFYDYPARDLQTYIVSGTYGRCVVAKLINHFLNKRLLSAYIGILGIQYNNEFFQMSFPTLSSLDNAKALYNLKNRDVKAVTLEATASSLNLRKLDIISPDLFVFNGCDERSSEFGLSNKEYYNWIRRFMYTLEHDTKVVLFRDDNSYEELRDSVENYVSFGETIDSDYQIANISLSIKGSKFSLIHNNIHHDVNTGLKGSVNVLNLTAAIAALNQYGYDIDEVIEGLSDAEDIEGIYQGVDDKYNIIVDACYDICNLEEIEKYARSVTDGKLITLYGIDYYFEDSRIEKMAKILNKYSDVVVFTEDGSYQSEVSKILSRCDEYDTDHKFVKFIYRSSAIESAVDLMNENDTLLILGKGNEEFLQMGLGKEFYFGDAYYAIKYIHKRKDEENYETEQIY